jgi:hypothetical protein
MSRRRGRGGWWRRWLAGRVGPKLPQYNAWRLGVFSQDAVVNSAVGERPVGVQLTGRVFEGPKQQSVGVVVMAGGIRLGSNLKLSDRSSGDFERDDDGS